MKSILSVLLFIPIIGHSQSEFYDTVMNCTGSKDELFVKSKLWFAESFKDSKAVIESEDKEAGFIVANASGTIFYRDHSVKRKEIIARDELWNNGVDFKMKVLLKDSRFRLIFYDIIIRGPLPYFDTKVNAGLLDQVRIDSESTDTKKRAEAFTMLSKISGVKDLLNSITKSLHDCLARKSDLDF